MRRFAAIVGDVAQGGEITIRAFDGSRAEAQGLLEVERATFDESPYDAAAVQALLSGGRLHAWLAHAGEQVVGFVAAFPTASLGGAVWEIDLLAVHPGWRGRGLARRLIRAAAGAGASQAPRARAVVAEDNRASASAFACSGFRASPERCHLLIYGLPADGRPRLEVPGVSVHEMSRPEDAGPWLALAGCG